LEKNKYFEGWFKDSAVEDLTKILMWEVTEREVSIARCPRCTVQSTNTAVPTAMILHVLIPSVCTGSLFCDFQALSFLAKQLNIRLLILRCNKICATRFTDRLQHQARNATLYSVTEWVVLWDFSTDHRRESS